MRGFQNQKLLKETLLWNNSMNNVEDMEVLYLLICELSKLIGHVSELTDLVYPKKKIKERKKEMVNIMLVRNLMKVSSVTPCLFFYFKNILKKLNFF